VRGGRGHHLRLDQPHQTVLSRGNVLGNLRHRPAIRRRLEIPLCLGQSLYRLKNSIARLFQIGDCLVYFFGSKILGLNDGG